MLFAYLECTKQERYATLQRSDLRQQPRKRYQSPEQKNTQSWNKDATVISHSLYKNILVLNCYSSGNREIKKLLKINNLSRICTEPCWNCTQVIITGGFNPQLLQWRRKRYRQYRPQFNRLERSNKRGKSTDISKEISPHRPHPWHLWHSGLDNGGCAELSVITLSLFLEVSKLNNAIQ